MIWSCPHSTLPPNPTLLPEVPALCPASEAMVISPLPRELVNPNSNPNPKAASSCPSSASPFPSLRNLDHCWVRRQPGFNSVTYLASASVPLRVGRLGAPAVTQAGRTCQVELDACWMVCHTLLLLGPQFPPCGVGSEASHRGHSPPSFRVSSQPRRALQLRRSDWMRGGGGAPSHTPRPSCLPACH